MGTGPSGTDRPRLSRSTVTDQEENPVTNGLVALVTVAIVVGLLAGIAVLFATNLLGVGDRRGTSAEGTGGATIYMPAPVATTRHRGYGRADSRGRVCQDGILCV